MNSVYKYLLSAYHMPSTVLDAQVIGLNKGGYVFCPPEACILVGWDNQQKWVNKIRSAVSSRYIHYGQGQICQNGWEMTVPGDGSHE